MCGIAGYVGFSKKSPLENNIKKCLSSLKRRGPDSNGVFSKRIKNKKILFIHSRLSIIDLNKNSNQPMLDENGVLIFNGMIYNYLELRKFLESKGVKFRTNSDSEVLLKMLNKFGGKALKMIDGMWSFAHYNFKKSQIIISRDRFGEKPLYFTNVKKNFFFGNSIKALKNLSGQKLIFDEKKVEMQIKYSDKSIGLNSNTLFKNINSLAPGHFIKINLKNNKFNRKNYWSLKIKNSNISFNSASSKLKKIIKNIVKTRVRSDVKNCMLISGGLDSNTIASYAKEHSKIEGYSLVSANKKYDETDLIKLNAKKNKLKTNFIRSRSRNSLKILKQIINESYNVLPATTALGFALLCSKIKKDKNKVILTGVGGDELFGGYYVNYLSHILSFRGKKREEKFLFWNKNIKKFIRNKYLREFENKDLKKNVKRLNFYIEGNELRNKYFLNKAFPKIKNFSKDIFYNNMFQNFFVQSIPTQNYMNDLISMHFSLEARAPFLSHKLAEYIYSLKKDYFMYKGKPKSLLREILKEKIDKKILLNYEKTGFYSPFNSFFNKKDLGIIIKIILQSKIIFKFINKNAICKLLMTREKNISHAESKLLFACLNLSILEKIIKK